MQPSVLIADDNHVNLRVLEQQLRRLGVNSALAVDGAEACDKARTARFDLILMDCQMPNMDGYSATSQIRRWEQDGTLNYHPVIIAVTAYAMGGHKETCLAAGMDDFITKPIDIEHVKAAMAKMGWTQPAPVVHIQEDRLLSILQDGQGRTDPESVCILNDAMAEIRRSVPQLPDHPQASRQAHKLKGMVALFGFSALFDDFLSLEKNADRMGRPEIEAACAIISGHLDDVENGLKQYISKP